MIGCFFYFENWENVLNLVFQEVFRVQSFVFSSSELRLNEHAPFLILNNFNMNQTDLQKKKAALVKERKSVYKQKKALAKEQKKLMRLKYVYKRNLTFCKCSEEFYHKLAKLQMKKF